ncbi:MAG: hypothetical protein QMB96_06630, partial [Acinetobacter towneri]
LTLSPTHKHSTTAHHAPLSSAIFHHPLFKRFILRTATEIDSELSSIHAKMIGDSGFFRYNLAFLKF